MNKPFILPSYVSTAIELLNCSGYQAYVVGGAVRSFLSSRPIHDYDMTTDALPEQMKAVFHHYPILSYGETHGTVVVLIDQTPLEITTFRTETTYRDHRHPDAVHYTRSLKEDCARRDFTMNAICYDNHEFIDFYHGKEDIDAQIIRTVGDPVQRFCEDALRILRAVRFASQLGFRIEKQTADAIFSTLSDLQYVAKERLLSEFNSAVEGKYFPQALLTYFPVFQQVIHELKPVDLTGSSQVLEVRLALLLKHTNDPELILKQAKYPNHIIQSVRNLLLCAQMPLSSTYDLRRLRSRMKVQESWFFDYISIVDPSLNIKQLINRYHKTAQDCCSLKQLAVNGDDMITLGLRGKTISDALNRCLELVMKDPARNHREILMREIAENCSMEIQQDYNHSL